MGEDQVTGEQAPGKEAIQIATGEPSGRSRYSVVLREGRKAIVSANAPSIFLFVERGLSIDKGQRRRYPDQSIFLDGVYDGPPFLDNKARQYSLDHHTGCVRAFTLATCEQAVVMLLQGLPLNEGDWSVYVNEPDLDSVLAAWVLFNHVEIQRDDRKLLRTVMPLVRVEGVIDAHGTELEILSALPAELHDEKKRTLDLLMAHERGLKQAGQWYSTDWVDYTRDQLEAVDQLVFPESYLDELLSVHEQSRVSIQDKKMAVLVRSSQGVYAVEARLRERYETQVAIVVLDQGGGRFTLRQVDPFLDRDLNALYKVLNRKDPAVRKGARTGNKWGGSGTIGGAPRKTGSQLTGDQILDIVNRVYGRPEGFFRRVLRLLRL